MFTPITYILADDDAIYRELILQYMGLIPNCACLAYCDNAFKAIEQLQYLNPDLLILDVEMPGLNGLQLAKSLTQKPMIIFVTS